MAGHPMAAGRTGLPWTLTAPTGPRSLRGGALVRLSPTGEVLQRVALLVTCATMPTFGGDDLRTLYITTAREKRPADELAREPWAGWC